MIMKSQGTLKATAKPFTPQDVSSSPSLGNISHSSSHVQPVSTAKKDVRKNKKFTSAAGLLNFQFDRPIQESPTAPVRKTAGKHRGNILTKAQYLQANFRFVLSPFTSPLESCLYDPDVIIPWECVACIIVPPESEDSVSESSTLICPVCLDAARIPRMTKCGHTYCYPCLLRHMSNDRSNRNKCPMCLELIDHEDLKPIQRSKSTDTATVPPVGSLLQFQLIEVQKGNVSALKAGSKLSTPASSGGTLRLTDVIPTVKDTNASFCRVVSATVDFMRDLFAEQQCQVAQYKQLCRSEHQLFDAGDVEAIPYLEEAESYIGAGRRKFEAKLLQELANGTIVEADDDSVAKAAVTVNNLSIGHDPGSASGAGGGVTDVSSVFRAGRATSHAPTAASSNGNHANSTSIQIYQKCNGDLVYLHPLCTKCIITHFSHLVAEGSTKLRQLPSTLTGSVVDVETIRITAEIKQRYSILRHLPLYAVVSLIEIDLIGLVDNSVLAMFDQELHKRALRRMEKQKKEKRERKQDEDKRLAEELVKADRIAHYHALKEKQDNDIQQLLHGPTVGSTESVPPVSSGGSTTEGVDDSAVSTIEDATAAATSKASDTISFAEVTLMGGSFPTLASTTGAAKSSSSGATVGAWGKPKVEPKSPLPASSAAGNVASGDASSASSGGGVWMRGAKVTTSEEQQPNEEGGSASAGGKKGKKFTKVSLLSTSSARSYR